MTKAHHIATDLDRVGMGLAGVAASFIQDRRALQAELDEEQALRNATAAQRAVFAVERQRQALVAAQAEVARVRAEAASLRAENAKLRDELARIRSRALEAEGRLVRLGKAAAARRAA
ncbi:response regulator receiver protein [Methylobacterium sp. NMS14P]|uniref:response regulator receiver protein n=1 Tax=Methylobacterium sp. NMS14P TaxID=2894310 RepID=UPI0023588863|nr:response regulator receiver protein [Methylobacterium sp. NMS14P]WCS27888.1 response regulator receiver protein [Methylobacterium sp. NMS14P]